MLFALGLAALTFLPQFPQSARTSEPGWIGVGLELDEGHAAPLRVSSISDDSPAERADLQPGDRLIALDGQPIDSHDQLIALLRERGARRNVQLTLRREVEIELDRRRSPGPRLGVQLALRNSSDSELWVVRGVESGWPAARAGLLAGDRLISVGGRTPSSFDELQEILAGVPAGHELRCEIERDLQLELARRPATNEVLPTPRAPSSGRFELRPEIREGSELRLRLLPHEEDNARRAAPQARTSPDSIEQQVRREMEGLNAELRALRAELAGLRRGGR